MVAPAERAGQATLWPHLLLTLLKLEVHLSVQIHKIFFGPAEIPLIQKEIAMKYFVWIYVNEAFQRMLTIQCDCRCAVSSASHNIDTA